MRFMWRNFVQNPSKPREGLKMILHHPTSQRSRWEVCAKYNPNEDCAKAEQAVGNEKNLCSKMLQ
jgi:hypothetical protein